MAKKNNGTKPTEKMKRLTVNLPPDVHLAFKTKCVAQGLEMSEVVVGFVERYIKKSTTKTNAG